MEIRAAVPEDVEAVVTLVESAYRGESSRAGWTTEADLIDGTRTDADEVRGLLDDLLVAVEGSQVVGCCALVAREDRAYFGTFAVRPGLQGSGVGSALLTAAEQRARDLGLEWVEMTVLHARRELIAYYERRGYAATGETRPFHYGEERHGRPRADDLSFVVLLKRLGSPRMR